MPRPTSGDRHRQPARRHRRRAGDRRHRSAFAKRGVGEDAAPITFGAPSPRATVNVGVAFTPSRVASLSARSRQSLRGPPSAASAPWPRRRRRPSPPSAGSRRSRSPSSPGPGRRRTPPRTATGGPGLGAGGHPRRALGVRADEVQRAQLELGLAGADVVSTSHGSVCFDASAQIGHCRSTYSVSVTGAFGSPSTPSCSGMPRNACSRAASRCVRGFVPPEAETAMAAAVTHQGRAERGEQPRVTMEHEETPWSWDVQVPRRGATRRPAARGRA